LFALQTTRILLPLAVEIVVVVVSLPAHHLISFHFPIRFLLVLLGLGILIFFPNSRSRKKDHFLPETHFGKNSAKSSDLFWQNTPFVFVL